MNSENSSRCSSNVIYISQYRLHKTSQQEINVYNIIFLNIYKNCIYIKIISEFLFNVIYNDLKYYNIIMKYIYFKKNFMFFNYANLRNLLFN